MKNSVSKKAVFDRGRRGFSKLYRRNQRDRLFNEILRFARRNKMRPYDVHHVCNLVRVMALNGELEGCGSDG